ncbi:MAG: hypothetical protein ACLFRV_06105 [Acidimicrobiales bacterium]
MDELAPEILRTVYNGDAGYDELLDGIMRVPLGLVTIRRNADSDVHGIPTRRLPARADSIQVQAGRWWVDRRGRSWLSSSVVGPR